MLVHAKWFALLVCLVAIGCNEVSISPSSDDGGGDQDGQRALLSGKIRSPGSARVAALELSPDEGYMVLAQSNETGEIYRGLSDTEGQFEIEIPDSEVGNTFLVTILQPDGQPAGPVIFAMAGNDGLTGLEVDGEVSLGTIQLPEDLTAVPIQPGNDADIGDLVDPDVSARLNDDGVPVGVPCLGKGDEALREGDEASDRLADGDRDGLIDLFDADDDGDGIVDDFDEEGDPGGLPPNMIVNFFMNLKIDAENASTYYTGSAAQIAEALKVDTIITLEVMTTSDASESISAVRALETPGPTYLPIADAMLQTDEGLAFTNWSDLDYAFGEMTDRFSVFVRPNAVMDAGDTFTVEVTFDDGTTQQYSRMINYVFKNIPKLLQYGPAGGTLIDFDITDDEVNGTHSNPIPFDGTQDLVLVFSPPPDETGALLTDLDYTFQIFYEAASDGRQLNTEIDFATTWPAPPAGFSNGTYFVSRDDLVLSADDTYTVTLPKELFPDVVTTTSSAEEQVGSYKIDVTAEAPTGNAAIMLIFRKQ